MLERSNFQKTNMIIININIAITKTDTIISEIEIAHVYNLTHACKQPYSQGCFQRTNTLAYYSKVLIKQKVLLNWLKKFLKYPFPFKNVG